MDFFDLMRYNHLDSYAAASAFFLFISLIPLLMLILSIVPYTPLTDEYLIKLITDLSPDRFDEFVTAIIMSVYDNSPAVLSISAIVCVWSASRSILAIQRGLNDILELKETRNYFLMRIRAAFYMLIMLASIVVILIISVFGERISSHVSGIFAAKNIRPPEILRTIVDMSDIIVMVVLFLIFLYFFTVLPNKKIKAKRQVIGAAFSAVGWGLYSALFSLYITNFNAFTVYGSLTTIVITLFWLYGCMYIMFVGAQINCYLSSRIKTNKMMN